MPKTVYLIIILLLLLIVLVIIQFSSKSRTEPIKEKQATPPESFRIISSTAPEEFIGITEPIKITLSRPVNLQALIYELKPETQTRVYANPEQTEITFDPKDAWNFDSEYSLKISKESQAVDGQALDMEYIYKFKTHSYSGI